MPFQMISLKEVGKSEREREASHERNRERRNKREVQTGTGVPIDPLYCPLSSVLAFQWLCYTVSLTSE